MEPGHHLPAGTRFDEYEITGLLGEGHFSVVYRARDHQLMREVAIKEYLPRWIARRAHDSRIVPKLPQFEEILHEGVRAFLLGAREFASFEHPALATLNRFWIDNGSAYMAMPLYAGSSLTQLRSSIDAPPDEAWLMRLLAPLLDALATIHARGCRHTAITPDKIIVLAGSGRPLMLDFGVARRGGYRILSRAVEHDDHLADLSFPPGAFVPRELPSLWAQLEDADRRDGPGTQQGASTDLYALAGVVYYCITGKSPSAASNRRGQDLLAVLRQNALYSPRFIETIERALGLPEQRPACVAEFRAGLGLMDAPPTTPTPVAPAPRPQPVFAKNDPRRSPRHLPAGTRFDHCEITGLLGEGGFSVVYSARDHLLMRDIAIKEYMPFWLASRTAESAIVASSPKFEETFRDALNRFLISAQRYAGFDHPALAKIHRVWSAHGTAYLAMPLYTGSSLRALRETLREAPDETWLMQLMGPVLEALASIHACGHLHLEIAPDTIMVLARTGQPLMLDFGVTPRAQRPANPDFQVLNRPRNFEPIEQIAAVPELRLGAWTDLYALAAVIYFLITGKAPPVSFPRLVKDTMIPIEQRVAAGSYSPRFLQAIGRALLVRPEDRPASVAEFRAMLGQ